MDRYDELEERLTALRVVNDKVKAERAAAFDKDPADRATRAALIVPLTVAFDELMTWAFENFPENPAPDDQDAIYAVAADMQDYFKTDEHSVFGKMQGDVNIWTLPEFSILTAQKLRGRLDATVLITIVRTFLSGWKAPLDTAQSEQFRVFARDYRNLILVSVPFPTSKPFP